MKEHFDINREMQIITSIFSAIGIVDVEKNSYRIVHFKHSNIFNLPFEGNYQDTIELFLEKIVAEEDRESMRRFLDPSTAYDRIINNRETAYEFLRFDGQFAIMNIALNTYSEDPKHTFILSLQTAYKDMIRYEKYMKEANGLQALSKVLGSSYVSVCLVDLNESTIEIKKPRMLDGIYNDRELDYEDSMNTFMMRYVAPDDIDRVSHEIAIDVVKEKLKKSNDYKVIFKGHFQRRKNEEFYCLHFGKIEEYDNLAVLGVTNIQETVDAHNKQMALLAALASDYDYIFYANLDENRFLIEKTTDSSRESVVNIVTQDSSVEETLEKYITTMVDEEEQEKFLKFVEMDNIKKILDEEKHFFYHYRVKDNPQGVKFACLHAVNVSTSPGEHSLVVGFKREDEVVREEYEKKKELEKQMRIVSALNNTYYSTYYIDLENDEYREIKASSVCRSFAGISGKTSKQFPRIVKALVDGEELERVLEFVDLSTLSERLLLKDSIEIEFIDKVQIWNRATFIVINRNELGGPSELLFTLHNIDEAKTKELEYRKKIDDANKKLTRYQQRIERTLAGAETGLWSLEVENGSDPRLVCDKTMLSILGFDPAMSPTEVDAELRRRVHKDDIEKFLAYFESLKEGRAECVYRWHHPTDGLTYMRCGGWRDKTHKNGFLFRGYHSNVTLQTTTEQENQRKLKEAYDEANRANAAKTDFLARMSHDIRTPLNGIIGMLEIAEKNKKDASKVDECLEKIRFSSKYLLSLINDVLSMTKLEAGEIELQYESFDIKELVDNITKINAVRTNELGLTVEYGYDIEHRYLLGSPVHIKQIVTNLVSNATKYNKPGGRIDIFVKETEFDGKFAHFLFTIEDTGIGMSEEFLEHIYEPFTQERNDARSRYQGTGLGMSIVKRLVEKMNGKIYCESEQDVGTKYTIQIQFEVDEEPNIEVVEEDDEISLDNLKVLLVEDNELNMEIADYLLRDVGAIVTKAWNGKEALDKFKDSQPGTFDVILMDVMMPIMDGLEATKAIRVLDRRDALDIPIIAMTANAFVEDQKKCKDAGMNGFLSKPISLELMLKTLAKFRQ